MLPPHPCTLRHWFVIMAYIKHRSIILSGRTINVNTDSVCVNFARYIISKCRKLVIFVIVHVLKLCHT
jgi:hypothetical protein